MSVIRPNQVTTLILNMLGDPKVRKKLRNLTKLMDSENNEKSYQLKMMFKVFSERVLGFQLTTPLIKKTDFLR